MWLMQVRDGTRQGRVEGLLQDRKVLAERVVLLSSEKFGRGSDLGKGRQGAAQQRSSCPYPCFTPSPH